MMANRTAWIRQLTLTRKLTALATVPAMVVMTLAFLVLAALDVFVEQQRMVRDLGSITDMAAINTTAATLFGDAKPAPRTCRRFGRIRRSAVRSAA